MLVSPMFVVGDRVSSLLSRRSNFCLWRLFAISKCDECVFSKRVRIWLFISVDTLDCKLDFSSFTLSSYFLIVKSHCLIRSSAIHEHCRLEGHSVDPSKIKVLSTEVNTFKRRIKEAIQIKLTKLALKRDNGYELAAIYDTILTPKRR